MAGSSFERHRLLWAELVAQLTSRAGVRVIGDDGSTRYEDREAGRNERPSATVRYAGEDGERRVELEIDRIRLLGPDGFEETASLNLSNAYRVGAFEDSEGAADGLDAPNVCHSARDAADEIMGMLSRAGPVPTSG